MLAAASAWDGLAAELESAGSTYRSMISGLIDGQWLGPSSMAMAAATTPYVEWMTTTALQAEEAAFQAKAAAAAHAAAFAMTVPPPVVAANRALLMVLVATNFFGQNTRRSPPMKRNTSKCGPRTRRRCTATPEARPPLRG